MVEKKHLNKVEYYLRNYKDLLVSREDILESSPSPPDGMPRGPGNSDTTGEKATSLAMLPEAEWVKLIDEVLKFYNDKGMAEYIEFIKQFYWERKKPELVWCELCIDKRTLYRWRHTILVDMCLKASSRGLIKF